MDTWGFARPMLAFAAIVLIAIGCLFGSCTCAIVKAAEPHSPAVHDRVDIIEVNHCYDANGRHNFDQIIFWDWNHPQARFQVRAWRLIKSPGQIPQRDRNDNYVSCWRDMQTIRKVVAPRKRETWTTYDPEVADRDFRPMDEREELVRCAD